MSSSTNGATRKSRSLVLVGALQYELQDLDVSGHLDPHEVRCRPLSVGICGSDAKGADLSTGRRRPPIIKGHEGTSEVLEVGSAVTRCKPGDTVVSDSTVYCNKCRPCTQGRTNLCIDRQVLGVSCAEYRRHGLFQQEIILPEWILHSLPEGVSNDDAALFEPVSVAAHAKNLADLRPQSTVVVVGTGLIGYLLVQMLLREGHTVIAVNRGEFRLQKAKALGAKAMLLGTDRLVDQLRETTDGGADAAFEMAGSEPTLDLAVRSVHDGGTVTIVGDQTPVVPFAVQWAVKHELTLRGSCAFPGSVIPQSLEMMARGIVQVGDLISQICSLADVPSWIAELRKPGNSLIKVVVRPQE